VAAEAELGRPDGIPAFADDFTLVTYDSADGEVALGLGLFG
jgi:hypothetical protein